MADTKRSGTKGAGETARGRSVNEAAGEAARKAGQAAARTAGEAGRRGGEALRKGGEATARAVRRGGEAAAGMARQTGEAAERGGEAAAETARQGMEAAARGQGRLVQGAAQEMDKTGRSLVGMVEEAAAGMRSLLGAPGFTPGNLQDAQQAVSKLVQGVMETNMRFADELLRRTGPSAVVDLQRQFLREYFDALAQGGTMLLRAARQAAEESLRPLEQRRVRERGGGTVADVMSKGVALASPDDTVQQAARLMSERDTGVLPVGEDDRLVGMVTDRDIAVRAAAAGKDPSKTKLREVMSGGEPRYVFDDEPVEKAAATMAEQQVQRLPVLNRDKRLVGIVSLGDLARGGAGDGGAEQALAGVSRPGGQHNQNGAASG